MLVLQSNDACKENKDGYCKRAFGTWLCLISGIPVGTLLFQLHISSTVSLQYVTRAWAKCCL